ncbi:hypothetical protein BpHYR1_025071 [Brachionus plicatilis]|uniref:Uncharacterized protein n=1 Tax=Brachionus plicatilis TaxID=10195 RepID=A0A3M7SEX7_BRAPC|nr:hypothetical protein BpHYR1_025071 [Brachionus plicatilis]
MIFLQYLTIFGNKLREILEIEEPTQSYCKENLKYFLIILFYGNKKINFEMIIVPISSSL